MDNVIGGIDYGKIFNEVERSRRIDRILLTIIENIIEKEYRDKEALNYIRWFGWPYFGAKRHIWDFHRWEWYTYHDPQEGRPYFDVIGGAAVYPLEIKITRVPTSSTYTFYMVNRYYWNPYKGIYCLVRVKGVNNIPYINKFVKIGSPYANAEFMSIFYEQNIRIRTYIFNTTYQSLIPLDENWHDIEFITFGDRHIIFFDGALSVYVNRPNYRIYSPCSLYIQSSILPNNDTQDSSSLQINYLVITEIGRRYVPYTIGPKSVGTTDTTITPWGLIHVKKIILYNPSASSITFTIKDNNDNVFISKTVSAGDTVILDTDGLLMDGIKTVASASGGYIICCVDL